MNPLITKTETLCEYAGGFLVKKYVIEHYTNGEQLTFQLFPKTYHDRISLKQPMALGKPRRITK